MSSVLLGGLGPHAVGRILSSRLHGGDGTANVTSLFGIHVGNPGLCMMPPSDVQELRLSQLEAIAIDTGQASGIIHKRLLNNIPAFSRGLILLKCSWVWVRIIAFSTKMEKLKNAFSLIMTTKA